MKNVKEIIKRLENYRIEMMEVLGKDPDNLVVIETLYCIALLKDALTENNYNICIQPDSYNSLDRVVENYNFSPVIFDDIIESLKNEIEFQNNEE